MSIDESNLITQQKQISRGRILARASRKHIARSIDRVANIFCFIIESLYLNSTFQLCVILHFIAIGQQFQSSSRKSNYILVFHTAGTETTTSQGTVFKSLGHDFISVKTTSSYFSTQRRWIYLYDGCRKQKEKPTQVSKCIVTNQPPNNNLKWNSATLSVL